MIISHPSDLAREVLRAINRRDVIAPPQRVVNKLFQLMYHASISREESEYITFHMVLFNPDDPMSDRVVLGDQDSWHYFPLTTPEEMTLANISKLAMASHPRSSALAIYPDRKGRLVIWGLIDQLNRYEDFIRLENSTAPQRPGLFEARIVGPGHILVTIGYDQVCELKIDMLNLDTIDIFKSGAVPERLYPGVELMLKSLLPDSDSSMPCWSELDKAASRIWMSVVQRLLFRVKGLKHGGAVLVAPEWAGDGLNVKYEIRYDRLSRALHSYIACRYEQLKAEYSGTGMDAAGKAELSRRLKKAEKDVEAAIWFVALLSRIDGLVLMNLSLEVVGFGVEITVAKAPNILRKVYLDKDGRLTRSKLNYSYFGTRHRSMMRYCSANPDSIGFVVSQDGDVRAVTRVENDVCVWENFRLLPEINEMK
jgi:hypothetical protein